MGEGRPRRELWRALGVLNLLALLIATTGGFGSLFAFVVTPDIRTYARMHVFVAFLALFAVALLLERLVTRRARLGLAACGLVLLVGLLDQVTPPAVRPYAMVKAHYRSDAALVRAIEAAVPAGGMILEVPHQSFPEGGPSAGGKPLNYSPLRPYLHSRSLRWSYPAMRGRSADAWAQKIATLPAADLVRAASDVGFDGILVHRAGYPDEGARIEGELAAALPSATRATGTGLSFFSLVEHNREALAGVPAEVRTLRRELALTPSSPDVPAAFTRSRTDPTIRFAGAPAPASIEVENGASFERLLKITMEVKAATPPMTLTFGGDLPAETVTVDDAGVTFERTLRLHPGRNTIRMSGEGKPAIASRGSAPADLAARRPRARRGDGAAYGRPLTLTLSQRERGTEGREYAEGVAVAGVVGDRAAVTGDEGGEAGEIEPRVVDDRRRPGSSARRTAARPRACPTGCAPAPRRSPRPARGAAQLLEHVVGAVGEMVEARAHHDAVGLRHGLGEQVEPADVGAAPARVHHEVAVEVEPEIAAAAVAQEVPIAAARSRSRPPRRWRASGCARRPPRRRGPYSARRERA